MQIILNQFKLYDTFSQGNLQQYMTLWSSDAEFRALGEVYRGKEEVRAFASGMMQTEPYATQYLVLLTVKGDIATISNKTPYRGTPDGEFTELDMVYRHKKEGNQWTIQVEDVDVPHATELLDADFDAGFRDPFYPVFRNAIETLDQAQVASFTAEDVKVISADGQQNEGLTHLMEELQNAPVVFQEDVYINREKSVIAVLNTDSGNMLLSFDKQPDGSLILREADFSLSGGSIYAAAPIETSFWSYQASVDADYKAYCFNSELPVFEGAYIRFPSVYEKQDNDRYLMQSQIIAADGISTIEMLASGKGRGNAFLLYNGAGVFEKFQMVGFAVSDEMGLEYHWGFYTYDITTMGSLELPASKDNVKRFISDCQLTPPDTEDLGFFKNADWSLLEGVKIYITTVQPLASGLGYLEGNLGSDNGSEADVFAEFVLGIGTDFGLICHGSGDFEGLHSIYFTSAVPPLMVEGYGYHEGLYYFDTEVEAPLIMPAPPTLPAAVPPRIPAKVPLEVTFWTVPTPEGANYQAYCFDSNLPALEGACLKMLTVEPREDDSFLAEGQIVAADGSSTIGLSVDSNGKGDVWTLYGGTGRFTNLHMAGFGAIDPETGLAYHWGIYTYDILSMKPLPLGLPEKKYGLAKCLVKCQASIDTDYFGVTYESSLPQFEGAKYYITGQQVFPLGDAILKGNAICEDDTTFDWLLHTIPQSGTSVWILFNGTGSLKGLRSIWFTPSEPNFFVVGHSDHEGMYYFDTEVEVPLIIPELPALPIAVPLQYPGGKDYTKVFFMELEAGLNMVSLPLESITPYTAKSFAELLKATVVIKLDETHKRFIGFTVEDEDDGFSVEGGKGYIVNTPEGGLFSFVGAAWTNNPPVEAAPTQISDSAWAFVLRGQVDEAGKYIVTARNKRTGSIAINEIDAGSRHFTAVWADLTRKSVVEVGDELEVFVTNVNGKRVSEIISRIITPNDIQKAYLRLNIHIGDVIPSKNLLGQNYPNPFNPETWIPYQLAEEANVSIDIYSAVGKLIKTLHLGQKQAEFYMTKEKSAYWDGRNESRERVASGVYFYQLRAGDFAAMRRMVIIK